MPNRTLVLGTLLAALTASALPGVATATSPAGLVSPYTLQVGMWECGVRVGGAPANAFLNVSLRRKGKLVVTVKDQVSGSGELFFDLCSNPKARVRPGDLITVLRTRTDQKGFTIPDVQPRIDVRKARASGTTPSGSITLDPSNCWARTICLPGIAKVLLGGAWSEPLGGDAAGGGDLLELTWAGAGAQAGFVVRSTMPVPYLSVKAGSPAVTGAARPNQKVKVVLRTKAGKVRAIGTGRATRADGGFSIKLRKHGKAVKVRPGDRLTSTLYPGAKLTVIKAEIAIDAITGHVTGHCFKDSEKVLAEAHEGLASSKQNLFTELDGSWLLDASGLGLPFPPGVTAKATCANDQGNEVVVSTVLGS